MKNKIALLLLLTLKLSYGQKKYPKDYFDPPVKIPIILAGTFGELRKNHFHSGIDIKTKGKKGVPVYAPADGYVSRIKVAWYGFGKALYIKHPKGYTTVYAHLQKFGPEIQEYVKKIQYKKRSFQTGNIFPDSLKFKIKRGQLIAYTGNTGSSGGPHLHYEIRNTATEKIINPMHFGILPKDTKKPTIKNLMAFPLDESSRINWSSKNINIPITKVSDGNYIANKITANGNIGFGINVFDQLNDANNKNGIYSLEMKLDGERVYYHDLETFSFSESKYINLLIDYKHYSKYKTRIQKTHKVKNNKLSIYKNLINNGNLLIKNNFNHTVEIIAKDFKGNSSIIKIPVRGVKNNTIFTEKDTTKYKITFNKFSKFTQKNVTIAFPKNTFYYDAYLDFSVKNNIAKIHNPTIPLNKKFTLTFDTSNLSELQKKQVYIANITRKKYPYYVSTKKKTNKVYTTSKSLGSYTLMYDNKKPIISLINFKNNQDISILKTLNVRIKDSETGIKSWKATIDENWILMEYDYKKGSLIYDLSDIKLTGKKHTFKLLVYDNVGNSNSKTVTFFKKE